MIEITGLHKVAGEQSALTIEALAVEAGEVQGVIGPPAGGRQALWELLIGRERPTAGTVRVAGVDPASERGCGRGKVKPTHLGLPTPSSARGDGASARQGRSTPLRAGSRSRVHRAILSVPPWLGHLRIGAASR